MRKISTCSLALVTLLALITIPAHALSVTINGAEDVFVPYGDCVNVTWTASTVGTVETYDWAFEGSQVSSASSYTRQICSPNKSYPTADFSSVELWVTGGGQAAYDSLTVHIIYEGACGPYFCN